MSHELVDEHDRRLRRRRWQRWVITAGAVLLMLAVAYDVAATYQNGQDQQTIIKQNNTILGLTATNRALAQRAIATQAHFHAQTVVLEHRANALAGEVLAYQRTILDVGNEIKAAQAAATAALTDHTQTLVQIQFLAAVAYSLAQKQNALTEQIQTDVQQATVGLTAGQAEINGFLNWLACNVQPPAGGTAACGARPMLPPT